MGIRYKVILQAGDEDGYINENMVFIISGRFTSNLLNYWKSTFIINFFFKQITD